ncbi:hypothetical protein [Coleofasciculus chthonoplastes]|uniref:hypothetical protein n=1 Tax=Coleofasciculus chthonoplastes TaxID=64178 RepID=UPI0032F3C898
MLVFSVLPRRRDRVYEMGSRKYPQSYPQTGDRTSVILGKLNQRAIASDSKPDR